MVAATGIESGYTHLSVIALQQLGTAADGETSLIFNCDEKSCPKEEAQLSGNNTFRPLYEKVLLSPLNQIPKGQEWRRKAGVACETWRRDETELVRMARMIDIRYSANRSVSKELGVGGRLIAQEIEAVVGELVQAEKLFHVRVNGGKALTDTMSRSLEETGRCVVRFYNENRDSIHGFASSDYSGEFRNQFAELMEANEEAATLIGFFIHVARPFFLKVRSVEAHQSQVSKERVRELKPLVDLETPDVIFDVQFEANSKHPQSSRDSQSQPGTRVRRRIEGFGSGANKGFGSGANEGSSRMTIGPSRMTRRTMKIGASRIGQGAGKSSSKADKASGQNPMFFEEKAKEKKEEIISIDDFVMMPEPPEIDIGAFRDDMNAILDELE